MRRTTAVRWGLLLMALSAVVLFVCRWRSNGGDSVGSSFHEKKRASLVIPAPLGLPPVPYPPENVPTFDKVRLGQRLFFDVRLSKNKNQSCASCHDPAWGFTIRAAMAQGTDGHVGNRHPPTLINVAYGTLQFWDGRVGEIGRLDSLERQALAPIQDPHEMGLDPSVAAQRLREDDEIRELFLRAFREEPTPDLIAKAIASFERTLLFGNAPFDRFRAGDEEALSHAARRGHDLFFWKATCSACHTGFNLTDNAFHPSVARGMSEDDEGRASVTRNPRDAGHFKTPTLRDVSRRSPYMHNGSLKTLEEVIDRYDRGGFDTGYWPSDNLEKIARLMSGDDEESQRFQRSAAPQLRAGFSLRLTTDEKRDLVEFLREGLTSQTVPSILNDTAAALPVSAN